MPTAWTLIAKGEARNERNPGDGPTTKSRPNGADEWHREVCGVARGPAVRLFRGAATNDPRAPLGRVLVGNVVSRVSPFAVTVGPLWGSAKYAH